jgi:hypothetical protein
MEHKLVKAALKALPKEERERVETIAKAYAEGFHDKVFMPVSDKIAKAKEDPKAAEELERQIKDGTLISDLTGEPIKKK